jgi:putative acetyltransferase
MPAMFTLRPGTPEDALAILEAHRDSVRGTAVGHYSHETIEAWAPLVASPERVEGFARTMASGEERVVVAVDASGKVLGFGSIVPRNDELRALYVRSAYGRNGIGRALLQRLEMLARKAGVKELSMTASINAESFYNANGFVSEGYGEHAMGSGGRMACVRMRKRL